MTDRMQFAEDDPRHHTAKIKDMMSQAMRHARDDVEKVSDPKAQALFEASAEGLGDSKAYDDIDQRSEAAFR